MHEMLSNPEEVAAAGRFQFSQSATASDLPGSYQHEKIHLNRETHILPAAWNFRVPCDKRYLVSHTV
jgi:hypothetical protein